jgi:hypothetical protein
VRIPRGRKRLRALPVRTVRLRGRVGRRRNGRRTNRLQGLFGRLPDDTVSHALSEPDGEKQHNGPDEQQSSRQPRRSAHQTLARGRTTSSFAARARRSLGFPIK